MPNIAVVLKEEIVRLARKELRNETEKLKKTSAQYRSEIAALKRRAAALEQQVARLSKANGTNGTNGAKAEAKPETPGGMRFSAKGFQTQRGRLGLSAAAMGKLLGVSGQTIYNWEAGTTRPRAGQLAAIADLRGAGKRRVAALLEGLQ